ncbi:MAG: hypothetical protein ACK4Q5_07890 [Saprospiraceae bacterium]
MNQHRLTNLQLELIKLFKYDPPEEQLMEIKQLLADYFAQKISDEMDTLWEERGWTEDTMQAWATKRMRTPYPAAQHALSHEKSSAGH